MKNLLISAIVVFASAATYAQEKQPQDPKGGVETDVTQGALRIVQKDGSVIECPLKHTDVEADVSGFIARVKVTQKFYNPSKDEKIEAVYVFPLPHGSAVDDMTMVIGDRRIVGIIKKRGEARAIYEQAIRRGQTAALLEQERPNIFVQSVGNIKPGQEINIEISYVDVLEYDMGEYTFHFPMVVGPRYNPAGFTGGIGAAPRDQPGVSEQKTEVPYLKPGERNGHDIALSLTLDAGVPVSDVRSTNHQATIQPVDRSRAKVQLSPADAIPNKDFVLKYKVVGEKPEIALLSHNPGRGSDGYFMLMIQPRIDQQLKQAPPREICFLLDVSGSMNGQPTAKIRDTMLEFFNLAKPDDTIQVITFASQSAQLFPAYVPATKENVDKALNFTNRIEGGGGTEMLKGIKMVLDAPVDPRRVRIVVMMSDGFIGNEAQIIDEVGKRVGDQIRFWTIGIGSSPNRMLIDGVAKQGGGMSAVLGLNDNPTELVPKIVERIHRAQLANVTIDWGRLSVYEIYPLAIPELWAGRPVILFGRYNEAGAGPVTIKGKAEGTPIEYPVQVKLPASQPLHGVLGTVWARKKIEDLSAQMYGGEVPELVDEITRIALAYRLMSQYTSFVAVDESDKESLAATPTPPRRVAVPVPMPDGVSWEGVFGGESRKFFGEPVEASAARRLYRLGRTDGPTNGRFEFQLGADLSDVGVDYVGANAEAKKGKLAEALLPAAPPAARPTEAPAKAVAGLALGDEAAFEEVAKELHKYDVTDVTLEIRDFPGNLQPLRDRIGTSSGHGAQTQMGEWGYDGVARDEPAGTFTSETLVKFIQDTVAPGSWQDEGSIELASKLADKGGQKVTFDFVETPLPDVITFLSKAAAVNITLDNEARPIAEKEKVTLKVKEMQLPAALDWILSQTSCRAELKSDAIHVVLSPQKKAQALLNDAKIAEADGKLVEAVSMMKQVYLVTRENGNLAATSRDALNSLLKLRRKMSDDAAAKQPALKKRLDLVIRRQPLEDAIAAIAKVSGMDISVAPGSIDDAKEILSTDNLEVTYLDLRKATVAQALDWLLDQFQLEWQMAGGKATVGTSRRLSKSFSTPWVYSLGYLATPAKSELSEDVNANRKLAGSSSRELLSAMQAALGAGKVRLLSGGRLLVYGTAADHELVNALLNALRGKTGGKPMSALPKDAADKIAALAPKTAARYAQSADARAAAMTTKTQRAVIDALDYYSWKLLAQALGGKADLEAISYLQFALSNPEFSSAIKRAQATVLASRLTWAIAEAARLLPKDKDLHLLAEQAAGAAAERCVLALEGSKRSIQGQVGALQYCLAAKSLAAIGVKSKTLSDDYIKLAADPLNQPLDRMQDFPAIAGALLGDLAADKPKLAERLQAVRKEQILGDDLTVLYSLACKRLGGETWENFRRVRAEIAGRQPLSGDALVIINRLSNPSIALAK